MSRGPLEVLREAARICDEMARCRLFDHQAAQDRVVSAGLHEAIAQVEALVEASKGSLECNQWAMECFGFDANVEPLVTALAPFTPGQDSEGGVSDA